MSAYPKLLSTLKKNHKKLYNRVKKIFNEKYVINLNQTYISVDVPYMRNYEDKNFDNNLVRSCDVVLVDSLFECIIHEYTSKTKGLCLSLGHKYYLRYVDYRGSREITTNLDNSWFNQNDVDRIAKEYTHLSGFKNKTFELEKIKMICKRIKNNFVKCPSRTMDPHHLRDFLNDLEEEYADISDPEVLIAGLLLDLEYEEIPSTFECEGRTIKTGCWSNYLEFKITRKYDLTLYSISPDSPSIGYRTFECYDPPCEDQSGEFFQIDDELETESEEDSEDIGYIYLLREREFLNFKQNVYKIGMTKKNNPNDRIKQYPKDSETWLTIKVKNPKDIETILCSILCETFTQRKDIGREYFEGNPNSMLKTIMKNIFN